MSNKYRGYTQLPNVYEALLPILTGNEFKVLYYIARKTIGFQNKPSDRISFSQFQKDVGISRDSVSRALSDLQERNLIYCDSFRYSLNMGTLSNIMDYLETNDDLSSYSGLKIKPKSYTKRFENQTKKSLKIKPDRFENQTRSV